MFNARQMNHQLRIKHNKKHIKTPKANSSQVYCKLTINLSFPEPLVLSDCIDTSGKKSYTFWEDLKASNLHHFDQPIKIFPLAIVWCTAREPCQSEVMSSNSQSIIGVQVAERSKALVRHAGLEDLGSNLQACGMSDWPVSLCTKSVSHALIHCDFDAMNSNWQASLAGEESEVQLIQLT